ncbi:DMT family transporter [Phenylobacterium aquaticum]|uniref:DMT family transporter n=1 Tax=Phenylobacterium aquaticum TaxID=1763816 RepID=UPI0026F31F13|nr:EamA family transporter [Phenylobacterium aquaticum]
MTDATGHDTDRTRALIVLLTGASVIGVGPIFVRLAEVGPAAAGMWRLVFSLPLLFILARRNGGTGAPTRATVLAGIAFAFDLGFWHYGIAYTSVAKATVLSNLTPVVVTAVAWIFLKQRPRRMFLVAVGLAVAGAWIMAAARHGGALGKAPALGDAFSVATAFWYAMYFLAVSSARQSQAATRIMFWSSLTGAPLMLLAALGLGERLLPITSTGWAACIGLGIMHVAGQGSIAWALGRLPAATASVVVLIQPVVAALLGWWIFGELFGHLQMLGAGIALSGVVLAQWASRARPVAPAEAV